MRRWRVVMLAAVGVACADGTDTIAGAAARRRVVLNSPNIDDAGLLFRVEGPAIDSVTASVGRVYAQRDANAWVVLVAGPVRNGDVARIWSREHRDGSAYRVTLLQVAAATTYAQRALTGYSLRVE